MSKSKVINRKKTAAKGEAAQKKQGSKRKMTV
jgi:hypothetical protein